MSELWISIRERKDRPGKWLVDVRRGAERNPRTFDSFQEARDFEREVRRADARGALKPSAPKPQTLSQLGEAFLAHKRAEGLEPGTLSTYRFLLMQTALPGLGADRSPREVSAADISAYLKVRKERDAMRPSSIRSEWDRLRAVFNFAKAEGIVSRNVVEDVAPPKVPKKVYDWLRSPEIGPFLDACFEDFAIIAKLAIFTGLRRREVVFLQRADFDFLNSVIQVRSKPHLNFRPKNGKERSVPIDPLVRPLLERYLKMHVGPTPDAWVFPQRDGTRRSASTRWFAVSVQRTAARAGINRKLTFHDLRRTYGAMLIEAGADIFVVSRLLGHSDVRITQEVYAPICGKFLAQEAAKLGRHLGPSLVRQAPEVPALITPSRSTGA